MRPPDAGRYTPRARPRLVRGRTARGGDLMPVIAAVNLKGGVGKTSTCLHLAGALSQLGRRVLLVDNDPQSSLTAGVLGPPPAPQLDPSATRPAGPPGAGALPPGGG